MASSEQPGDELRSEPGGSSADVPEADAADAADQRTAVDETESQEWFQDVPQDVFDEAAEADVIEQSLDAGEDDEERR